jgi:hypothetical protein
VDSTAPKESYPHVKLGLRLQRGLAASDSRGTVGEESRPEPRQHSLRSSRANSLVGGQQQPGGLLDSMLHADGPGQREVGENLLVWLELTAHTPGGGPGGPEQGLPPSEDIVDGTVNKHQEAAEVEIQTPNLPSQLSLVPGCGISYQTEPQAVNGLA